MSESLHVSEAQIGLLVTVFAFTVVITSTPLTALTKRWPRHGMIVGILVVLAVSNLLTAFAPDYAFVVFSRILGGIAHGMFWSIVGAYAGHLVPKEQIGRAVSITLGGGTLAFVFGVPLGTFAGHVFGWRLSFWSARCWCGSSCRPSNGTRMRIPGAHAAPSGPRTRPSSPW
jgi:predicted MFS family arabinose efflux permease